MHESVRERDLDHLLLEELHASDRFLVWLLAHVPSFQPSGYAASQVMRSPRRESDGRQTDLHVDFLCEGGALRARLLIENKVSDSFQDGQAESYRDEIAVLRGKLGTENAAAVLVGPEHYRHKSGAECFDAFVSLDAVLAVFRERMAELGVGGSGEMGRRIEVKLDLLERLAGKKTAAGDTWQAPPVPAKREFSARYREFMRNQLGAEYIISESSDGPGAITKLYSVFPAKRAFPFEVRLRHEFGKVPKEQTKYANLQFPGKLHLLDAVRNAPGLLPADRSIYAAEAGGALAIRIDTPAIDPQGELFNEQVPKLKECADAIRRLITWLSENRGRITAMVGDVP